MSRFAHSSAPPLRGPGGPGLGRPFGPGPHGAFALEQADDTRATVVRLWSYMRRHSFMLLGVVILVALNTGLGVLGPYFMGQAIDVYITGGDLPGLARWLALMAGVLVLNAVGQWLQEYTVVGVSQQVVRDLRADLFARLQTLSLRFFDQRPHGELMSRLTNDVDTINMVLSSSITNLIGSALSLVLVTVMMLLVNVNLALVALVILPMTAAAARWLAMRTRQGFRLQQEQLGALNGLIEETIAGQRVVKAYGREAEVVRTFDEINAKLRQAATRAQIFAGLGGPMMNFVNNTGRIIVIVAGGWLAVQGIATIGTVAAFINYTERFSWPLNQLGQLYNSIQSALAGAERVFQVMDEAPDLPDAPDARPLGRIRGEVMFDHVSFGYEPGVPVLKRVSLRAEPGQMIALVGPTGAGKTTIINLLTRFYDVDEGAIYIDGVDIRRIPKDDLRRRLGIVLQDNFLFADTVMENIRYGRLDATDDEVKAAARLANAETFIHRLPDGYHTRLTERGGNLSQGQRQLIAIARAILAQPDILILDEATSSVDTRTEKHVQEALLRLMRGRTSFVIAHRLSTIRDADQVLVIHGGEVIERGTHQALLAQRGFYHHLYYSQFKGQERLLPTSENKQKEVLCRESVGQKECVGYGSE
ncbi:MAG: ABC transporter ATP-binding protein [Anaerolineae bacterium]|nr:ABC transporter ATP-binding protein/permease [Thermoflexales bacterium]MDW8407931.1 ABC transporter ATP-binding protein [Anaerolineae bacterium]